MGLAPSGGLGEGGSPSWDEEASTALMAMEAPALEESAGRGWWPPVIVLELAGMLL